MKTQVSPMEKAEAAHTSVTPGLRRQTGGLQLASGHFSQGISFVFSRDQLRGLPESTTDRFAHTHHILNYSLSMHHYLYFHYLCENGFDKILTENQNFVLLSTLKLYVADFWRQF